MKCSSKVCAGLVVVATVAALAGCDNGGRTTTESSAPGASSTASETTATSPTAVAPKPLVTEYNFVVSGGKKTAGPSTIEISKTQPLSITITSDKADEIHAHGFDKEAELSPGVPASLSLSGAPAGVYELELHHSGLKLATITVKG